AARGHRGHDRGSAGRSGHARHDDRHRRGARAPAKLGDTPNPPADGSSPMNGVHDLGGMHGFGPVVREPDEPVFHADWERRAFGLTLAGGAWGRWNLDMSRSEREQMPPADYLATSYYEHWLFGLERLLVKHGLVSPDELARAQRGEPTPSAGPIEVRE